MVCMKSEWPQPDKLQPDVGGRLQSDGHGGFRWAWTKRTSSCWSCSDSSRINRDKTGRDPIVPQIFPSMKLFVEGKGKKIKRRGEKQEWTLGASDPPRFSQRRARTAPQSTTASPSNVDDATQNFFSSTPSSGTRKTRGGADRVQSVQELRSGARSVRPNTTSTARGAKPERGGRVLGSRGSNVRSRGASSAGAAARGSKPSVRRALALGESERGSDGNAAAERSKWYAVNLVMRLQENALAAQFLQPLPA